jgi:beta-lactam-binding protein with PASTA domain
MSKIFLNYRREDSAPDARSLYDHLVMHFGPNSVFIDIDRIDLGADFVESINEKVGLCQVLLVLIGKQWLTSSDSTGRRLDNPNDFVRLEIVAANERRVRIIPVLVEGASMPREDQLPDALRFLARRNATELSYHRFRDDVNHLIKGIEQIIKLDSPSPPPAPVQPAPPRWKANWMIYGLAAIFILGGSTWLWTANGATWFRRIFAPQTSTTKIPSPGISPLPTVSAPITDSSPPLKTAVPPPKALLKHVPSVVNLSLEEATAKLRREGFRAQATRQRSSTTDGTVLQQDPAAGHQAPDRSLVRLVVADQLKVPKITGMSVEGAQNSLQAAGFSLRITNTELLAGLSGPDSVQSQDPPAGTSVSDAGPVNVVINRAGVVAPNLASLPLDEARAVLSKWGLAAGNVTWKFSNAVPGTVVEQSPNSGRLIPKGGSIDLVLSNTGQKKAAGKGTKAALADRVTITSANCDARPGDIYRLQVNGSVASGSVTASLGIIVDGRDYGIAQDTGRFKSYLTCGETWTGTFLGPWTKNPSHCDNRSTSPSPTSWEYVAFGSPVHGAFKVSANLERVQVYPPDIVARDSRTVICR